MYLSFKFCQILLKMFFRRIRYMLTITTLLLYVQFSLAVDKIQANKSPQQPNKKTSNLKLLMLKFLACICGTIGVIILLYVTRTKWCCIESCRGKGFLKNKIRGQIDAYMPGVRVNDETGKTEYYEPTDEEMAAFGSVLHVIKDMASQK